MDRFKGALKKKPIAVTIQDPEDPGEGREMYEGPIDTPTHSLPSLAALPSDSKINSADKHGQNYTQFYREYKILIE